VRKSVKANKDTGEKDVPARDRRAIIQQVSYICLFIELVWTICKSLLFGEKYVTDASARDCRAMMQQIENRKAKEKMRMAGNMNFLKVYMQICIANFAYFLYQGTEFSVPLWLCMAALEHDAAEAGDKAGKKETEFSDILPSNCTRTLIHTHIYIYIYMN